MNVREVLEQARDALTVRRVVGDPIERDGTIVLPVATICGGAGGGAGQPGAGEGWGGGWCGTARPAGAFVIKEGHVHFVPAVDVNRIVLGAQVTVAIGLLVLGGVLLARHRRGSGHWPL